MIGEMRTATIYTFSERAVGFFFMVLFLHVNRRGGRVGSSLENEGEDEIWGKKEEARKRKSSLTCATHDWRCVM
jgi:hypothetical protein